MILTAAVATSNHGCIHRRLTGYYFLSWKGGNSYGRKLLSGCTTTGQQKQCSACSILYKSLKTQGASRQTCRSRSLWYFSLRHILETCSSSGNQCLSPLYCTLRAFKRAGEWTSCSPSIMDQPNSKQQKQKWCNSALWQYSHCWCRLKWSWCQ